MVNVIFPLQDFLGLVEKLYYLSGKYEIQLTIGDASMVSTGYFRSNAVDLRFQKIEQSYFFPFIYPGELSIE